MSLLPSLQEVVIASPFEGVLLFEGKPVPGVKIKRHLSWFDKSESMEDFIVTNRQGYFSFPLVIKTLKLSNIVHFSISQEINAIHNGETVLIWFMNKGSKTEFGELGGKPVNLTAEISSEETITRDYNNPLMSRCTWVSLEPWSDEE